MLAQETVLTVPIGESRVARAPARFEVHGLGSCVVVFLNDPNAGLGGLCHILLPEPPRPSGSGAPGRYATHAIRSLVEELVATGAARSSIVAKLAGGAKMFAGPLETGVGIGERNAEAALRCLALERIPVLARDLGGTSGRTVFADLAQGHLIVRSLRSAERVL